MDRGDIVLLSFITLAIAAAIAATGWLFLYKKDYTFVLEAACDPTTQTCFTRDCLSDESDCPPNGLEAYKIYHVAASDFYTCSDNSCAAECASGAITCEEEVCSDDSEDACSANPEAPTE